MEGFNHKYYDYQATEGWVAYDETKNVEKAKMCFLDTIARSLASIADSLEKMTGTASPKECDYDAGLVEDDK